MKRSFFEKNIVFRRFLKNFSLIFILQRIRQNKQIMSKQKNKYENIVFQHDDKKRSVP